MQPRLLFGVQINPTPIIMTILATIFGLLIFVFIVGLLMLGWLENLIITMPLLAVLVIGGALLTVVGFLWLLNMHHHRSHVS